MAVREVPTKFKKDQTDQSDLTDLSDHQRWSLYARWVDHADPAVRANAVICLIHQANYLLDQQIRRLEQDFLKQGGLRERMTRARLQARTG